MLTIEPYDPAWPERFRKESIRLRRCLGATALRIEHVGSTAVAGLAAKPVIDIQVSVASLEPAAPLAEAMARLGYSFVSCGDFDRVYPFFTRPAAWPSTHHVHLCVAGGEQEAKHLAFRDGLRKSPAVAGEYVTLKRALAAAHAGATAASREAYSLAKSEFVQGILDRAASGDDPRRANPARKAAGYSGTPLAQKLGIGQGIRMLLVDEPEGYRDLFDELPRDVQFDRKAADHTALAHVFVTRRADLGRHLAALRKQLNAAVPVWVSWPKKSARVPTDVTEDTIREVALPLGFVDVKVCAVSERWSGLKLVVRKELR